MMGKPVRDRRKTEILVFCVPVATDTEEIASRDNNSLY